MVSRDDLTKINALNGEKDQINRALDSLAKPEAHIDALQIGPDAIEISTVDWTYPPQMVDAIKANLTARQSAIEQELTGLGVTLAQPETQAAPAGRRAR